jgi:hypothetical protein
MRKKIGWLLVVVLLVIATVLGKSVYRTASGKIRDFQQTIQGGMMMASGGSLQAPDGLLTALGGTQKPSVEALAQEVAPSEAAGEAHEEAQRQEAIAELSKQRAKAEADRRKSGDPTPRVEAILAGADNRLCVLIDNDLIPEGGTIQGFCVRKIHADSVQFEKAGQVWVQRMQ